MTVYKYKTISRSSLKSNQKPVDEFIKDLNEQGKDGWLFLSFYDERNAILSKKTEIIQINRNSISNGFPEFKP